MPQQDPKDMTVAQLDAEFKTLANDLSPITSRRTALDKEKKKRVNRAAQQSYFHRLTTEEKEALYWLLKEDLGL